MAQKAVIARNKVTKQSMAYIQIMDRHATLAMTRPQVGYEGGQPHRRATLAMTRGVIVRNGVTEQIAMINVIKLLTAFHVSNTTDLNDV